MWSSRIIQNLHNKKNFESIEKDNLNQDGEMLNRYLSRCDFGLII